MPPTWIDTYQALSEQGVSLRASQPARLVVTGSDRLKFLQNFCTNDTASLAPGEACEAFFLNPKGHILVHALLSVRVDRVVLFPQGGDAAALALHLDRYILRDDVELEVDESPYWLVVGGREGPPGGSGLHVQPHSLLHLPAWYVDASGDAGEVEQVLADGGYPGHTDAQEVLRTLRVESGLPLGGVDYGDGALPQELDRDSRAIHFNKGCYLGQETVARIDALGHVNKQLRGIAFPAGSTPEVGTSLHSGEREVGRITSLVYSPLLDAPLGLAMIRREAASSGTTLEWAGGEATVVALPVPAPGVQ